MFVHSRAKARAVALVLAGVASVQLLPSASATEFQPPAAVAKVVEEAELPKKAKKTEKAPTQAELEAAETERKKKERAERIELVMKVARKQLGKPYRWAATGPNSFDCSGFTQFVWRTAGVEIPRTSSQQRAGLPHVPMDRMKPGDLVFSSGHVGLYIGKGQMIHSPRSGRTVSIDPIHSNTYAAGRPLP